MTDITQTITDPGTAPTRVDPDNFDTRADAFLTAFESYTTEFAAYASQANTLSSEVNTYSADAVTAKDDAEAASVIALNNANFVGLWDNQSGAAAIPYCVLNDGSYWQLIAPLADVTTVEPGITGGWATYWTELPLVLNGGSITTLGEDINALSGVNIDYTDGGVVTKTISATTTFTFANPISGINTKFELYLTNGGSQTVNWPGTVDFAGGTAPTLTASGLDVLVFSTNDGGTNWYGFAAGLDVKTPT